VESEWNWQGDEFINNLRGYAQRLIGYSIHAEAHHRQNPISDLFESSMLA